MNLYREFVSKISSSEFEIFCFDVLKEYANSECLTDFSITHNTKIKTNDGEYQIDMCAEFVALSVKFKVIVECKRNIRPIEREKVVVLSDKVRSIGAHKGILISTSGFQSGAIEYSRIHGIALIQIIDKNVMHIQASSDSKIDLRKIEFIKQTPPYYAFQYSSTITDNKNKKIYPSKSMDLVLKEKIDEQFSLLNNKLS
jgi:hypothetical protein